MDDLTQRIVEAGARAMHDANPGAFRPWDVIVQAEADGDGLATRVARSCRDQARACLSAAHALAEQEGVIFTRVPGLEEPDPAMSPSIQHWADGYNAHRAATLAGKVKL
jgi:hypothetical protein